jgi:hypothetical protein
MVTQENSDQANSPAQEEPPPCACVWVLRRLSHDPNAPDVLPLIRLAHGSKEGR